MVKLLSAIVILVLQRRVPTEPNRPNSSEWMAHGPSARATGVFCGANLLRDQVRHGAQRFHFIVPVQLERWNGNSSIPSNRSRSFSCLHVAVLADPAASFSGCGHRNPGIWSPGWEFPQKARILNSPTSVRKTMCSGFVPTPPLSPLWVGVSSIMSIAPGDAFLEPANTALIFGNQYVRVRFCDRFVVPLVPTCHLNDAIPIRSHTLSVSSLRRSIHAPPSSGSQAESRM